MLGLQPIPTVGETLVWLLYAVPMGLYVLWPARRPAQTERRAEPIARDVVSMPDAARSPSIGVLAIAATSCGGSGSGRGSATGDVAVTMKDFSIDGDARDRSPPATSRSRIQNDGPSAHEFVIIRTDDAPDALPVENGVIPEDQVDLVDEAEDIAPGTDTSLSANLTAGSYVLVCNLPVALRGGHARGVHRRVNLSLFLPTARGNAHLRLFARMLARKRSLGELTALNLQSIFRSGPALAAGSVRKRIEARSLGTTA